MLSMYRCIQNTKDARIRASVTEGGKSRRRESEMLLVTNEEQTQQGYEMQRGEANDYPTITHRSYSVGDVLSDQGRLRGRDSATNGRGRRTVGFSLGGGMNVDYDEGANNCYDASELDEEELEDEERIDEMPAITVTFDSSVGCDQESRTFKGQRSRRASAPIVRLDSE